MRRAEREVEVRRINNHLLLFASLLHNFFHLFPPNSFFVYNLMSFLCESMVYNEKTTFGAGLGLAQATIDSAVRTWVLGGGWATRSRLWRRSQSTRPTSRVQPQRERETVGWAAQQFRDKYIIRYYIGRISTRSFCECVVEREREREYISIFIGGQNVHV